MDKKELNNLNQVPVYGDTSSVGKTKKAAFKQQSRNSPNRPAVRFSQENII